MESQLFERPASRHFARNRAIRRSVAGSLRPIQTTYIPHCLRHSLSEEYPKHAGVLQTSNQRIVENPVVVAAKGKSKTYISKQKRGVVSARAPFSGGDREVSRRSRRGKPGRTLLLQSVLLAKQVITRTSGRKLGVVSQLWVDAVKWEVVALSVKPSLLFGEEDTILLSSLRQVGDVLLVHDESAVEENVSLVQLGYYNIVGSEVVTENGVYLGKIRDFKFDPEDGAIASLVFDGLGISIVPSAVVSTYAMGIGEVLSAGSDRIIVRDGAASRVKRLSMGILEKLSLAEPPWRQDDILYSTYGSAMERRQSRYESRPETRRESFGEPSSRAPPNASSRPPAYDDSRAAPGASTPAYEPRERAAYEDSKPAYGDARPAYEPRRSAAYEDRRTPAYERAESSAYGRAASEESSGRGSRTPSEETTRERGNRFGAATGQPVRRSDSPSQSPSLTRPASRRANSDLDRRNPALEQANPVLLRENPSLEGGNTIVEWARLPLERRAAGLSPDQPFERMARASPAEETTGPRPVESEAVRGRFRGAAFGSGEGSPRRRVVTGDSESAAEWDTALERYPARRGEFAEAREPVYLERGSFPARDGPVSRPGPVERSPVRTEPSPRLPVKETDREDPWRVEAPGTSSGRTETTGYDASAFDAGRGEREAAVGPPRSGTGASRTFVERTRGMDMQSGNSGRGVDSGFGGGGGRRERRPVPEPLGQASANDYGVETSGLALNRSEGVSPAQQSE